MMRERCTLPRKSIFQIRNSPIISRVKIIPSDFATASAPGVKSRNNQQYLICQSAFFLRTNTVKRYKAPHSLLIHEGDKMKFILTTLPVFLIACSGDKESDSAIIEETFTPTEGIWKFEDLSYDEDNCNFANTPLFSVSAFESLEYTLTNISDTEVQFVDTNDYTFDCTRDAEVVSCPSTIVNDVTTYNDADNNPVLDEQGNPVDPDATNTITTEFVTTFSADVGTLSATLSGSCEGADCDAVYESYGATANPCSSSLSGVIRLQ